MKRRTAREKALQALFQIDVSSADPGQAIEHVLDGAATDPYLERIVYGVVEHGDRIDEVLKAHLEKWTLDRLATVDRNLLRLSAYELLYCSEDVPANVVIDESIEIAKTFGDDNSSRFINGILSKIKQLKF